ATRLVGLARGLGATRRLGPLRASVAAGARARRAFAARSPIVAKAGVARAELARRRRLAAERGGDGRRVEHGDAHADRTLDLGEEGPLLGSAERDGRAGGAGARGAADAVHVALGQ